MWVDKQENRFKIFVGIIVFVFLILTSRLGYLQIMHGEEYKRMSESNSLRLVPVTAPRGIFYDRNGKPMVTSRTAYTVSIVRMGLKEADLQNAINGLSSLLNMDVSEINKKITESKAKGYPLYEPVRIQTDVANDILVKIEEHSLELPGVIIEEQPVRDYINKDFASHVFGYVGEINADELKEMKSQGYRMGNIIGKTGLEKQFDKELRGIDGGQQIEVNAAGKPLRVFGEKAPVAGDNLYLTINNDLQKVAEEALVANMQAVQKSFPQAKAAACVVMDPRSGAILAMTSKPSYDPNLFVGGISKEELPVYRGLVTNSFKPMINRAIRGVYPPGSTFKMVTAIAALEEGKINKDTIVNDSSGVYWAGGKPHCWKKGGHGPVNLAKAIGVSCNVYFYEVGRRLGIDALSKYARLFGLGKPTGLELPPGEKSGRVAERIEGKMWYLGQTLSAAIGQGDNTFTPLQMANYISTLVNGGTRYKPYLVSKVVSPEGKLVNKFGPEVVEKINLSPANVEAVKEGMLKVTSPGGTGAGYFTNFPIAVGGKTGTAQNPHGADHGWFVGFAPYDNPQIVIVIIVEQGGHGGSAAAPVARAIFAKYFGIDNKTQGAVVQTEEEGSNPIVKPRRQQQTNVKPNTDNTKPVTPQAPNSAQNTGGTGQTQQQTNPPATGNNETSTQPQ